MKHQVIFSLKNNEKLPMNVVCCSRDWCIMGKPILGTTVSMHVPYLFGYKTEFFHSKTIPKI